jgi:signal transduction histidine kinase
MVLAFEVTERVQSDHEYERLLAERDGLHAEREKLLSREREARTYAERASMAKDEFLAMLGHELRNPLAPIVMALELLRRRGDHSANREHAIIERQVKHLTTLVDDLLDVSAITRGKIALNRERIELSLILDRAIEIANPLMEQRQHDLIVRVPRRGLVVDADPVRIAQVISNLLTNAAKYTEPGGQITVSAQAKGTDVELCVADNGLGISKEMLPHVFELFMQERQPIDRASGGLGLGLAIVQNLMTMHAGSVRAASEGCGAGSSFTICLPSAASNSQQPLDVSNTSQLTAPITGAVRVLIIDDNSDAAEMLEMALKELGCETRIGYDGPSALKIVESFRPDLAFLDIGLPVMDGYELARHLRQRFSSAELRLIAVTGYGQKADIERSLQAGFDEHLVKPVEFRKLNELFARFSSN